MNSVLLLVLILAAAVVAMCLIAGIRSRRTEERLRRQNILLDGALNNMTQGVNMFDRAGTLVLANERYIEMYGLTRAIVRPGVAVRGLVEARIAAGTFFKTDPDEYTHELMTSIVERKPTRVTRELADGRMITVVNQPMEGGGWVVTHEDVTERARAERELESTRNLRTSRPRSWSRMPAP
jgi:PAS domain-containing protein